MQAELLSPRSASPAGTRLRRQLRPDIQGLRAIAVLLVLADHANLPLFGGGFVGVDVFFVVSGFLISGHLVDSLTRTGRVSFVDFYLRRARRILPAAFATIVATAAVSFFIVSPLRVSEIFRDGIAAALYVPNLLFAAKQTDYLAGTAPSPFQHFWSLGVEEQFYLFWPLLLLASYWLSRHSLKWMTRVVAVVAVVSLAASVVTTPALPSIAFFSPHTRAWEFAVGALIALLASTLAKVPTMLAEILSWCGLAVILVAATTVSSSTVYPGLAALLPVTGAALLISFGQRGSRGVNTLLRLRPIQFVGTISYSLYLVHWPVLVLVHEHLGLGTPLPIGLSAALTAGSVPIAWALYRLVETPFRTTRAPARKRAAMLLAVAGIGSVVLAGGLVAGGAAAAQLPLTSSLHQTGHPLTRSPAGTPFVPSNLVPGLSSAVADTGEIYSDGCQQGLSASAVLSCSFGDLGSTRTIALFGDSHAGRWFPAVELAATSLGYRLDTYTKSGCRSEETSAAWNHSRAASCTIWRNAVVAHLAANPPEAVILANHLGPGPDKDSKAQLTEWEHGLADLYDRLPSGSEIITLADTPQFDSSPVLCLSAHLTNANACAASRAKAFNPSIRTAQTIAAQAHGADVIDLTDYFCNRTSCPAIIGNALVYSDEHHLTATFSHSLGTALTTALRPILGDAT